MLTRGKAAALQEIRRWTIEDVVKCLEKNGLGDCGNVFKKREVVGEMLVELTEGKLALWKRDINQSEIRALVAFVDDLKMHPEKYLLKESCASEMDNLPTRGFPLKHEFPSSSGCCNITTNASSQSDKKQEVKGPPLSFSGNNSPCNSFLDSNRKGVLPPGGLKPPDKPPLFKRPDLATTVPRNKAFLDKPSNKFGYHHSVSPTQLPILNNVPQNSTSRDALSQDTNSDESNLEQKLKEAPTNTERLEDSSHIYRAPSEECKPVNRPPLFRRPKSGTPVGKTSVDGSSESPGKKEDECNDYRTRSPLLCNASNNGAVLPDGTLCANKNQNSEEGTTESNGANFESKTIGVNCSDPLPPDVKKTLDEPTPSIEKNANSDLSIAYDKVFLPKPPDPSCKTVENIISTVNIGAIEARVLAEQLDEEFYESFDGENIADVAAIRKALFNQTNEEKINTNNTNSSKPVQVHADEKTENNQQNVRGSFIDGSTSNCVLQTSLMENDDKVKHPDSPPTPPPRNPTMKLNETNVVLSRLHSSSMSLHEESLHRRNPFDRPPETGVKAASHQSLMISLNNLNLMSANNSYLHSSWNSNTPSEQNSETDYEILDGSRTASDHTDSLLSEVYESIKEQVQIKGNDEDGYYLQPDPRFPIALSKNEDSSSDDSRHFPLPPKASLPDVVIPSAPPPSPPRKKSEDSSSSTTSGSGDSMSGRLGGLLRKVISRPPPLLVDHGEKTPSGTPELKKTGSFPPPTTRPPPPVEQRPSAFQRPLPPTPEGTKFQFPSPKKTHNSVQQQTTKTSFKQMPWFHNIDRRRAEELLSNSEDGYFVIRPSTQTSNPLTLTLWYKNRIFNISVRHRSDGKYALGTEKPNEQSFNSIEEMVAFYQSEKLVLYSAGERAGRVLLTNSPKRTS